PHPPTSTSFPYTTLFRSASGVMREFLDGLFVHQLFGDRLGLEAWGGHPVSTQRSEITGDGELGGKIFWRGVPKSLSPFFRDLTRSEEHTSELQSRENLVC